MDIYKLWLFVANNLVQWLLNIQYNSVDNSYE